MRIVITVPLMMLFALNPALAATGAPDTGAMNELLRIFENTAGQWPAIIKPVTTWLFWTLVTISWAWGFGEMALKGADVKELLAELFKRTFMIGFFWWLLISAPQLAAAIVNGFTWIGGKLAGNSLAYTSISPSSIFDIGISLVTKILKKLSITNPVDSLGYVLVAIGIVVIFAFITLQLMVLIIQYYFFLNAGVVMMGFLGHEWSREYGINYFKLMIGLGVKYLTMQLIIVLTLDITQGWLKESDLTWTQLVIILPTMIIIWGLIREVPQMAQSLVSGSDQTTGNAVAGAMQAAAAMAAIAAGAFAAAGGGSKMMQGAGNMSQLLQGAWNEASGGEGGGDGEASTNESDPATGTPPDSASSDSGGDDGASNEGSEAGYDSGSSDNASEAGFGNDSNEPNNEGPQTNDSAQSGSPSETSSSADNGSTANSENSSGANGSGSDNASGNAGVSSSAPKKGFAATAALAASIAGKAIGNELKGSAKNAFKSGMSKFTAPFSTPSNSVTGRAAQSLNPNKSTNEGRAESSSSVPWMQQSGGFQNLSSQAQQQARNNFNEWKEDPGHTFGLDDYVSYTQDKNNHE